MQLNNSPKFSFLAYSLGGNFALRVALYAPGAGLKLDKVIAVSPVISPAHAMHCMDNGPAVYQHYFKRKWRRSLRIKQACFPNLYDFSEWFRLDSLTGQTRYLIEKYTSIASLDDYLEGYSVARGRLKTLQIDTTIVAAEDDPVIPLADFHQLELPACAELVITAHGGHCAFLNGWKLDSWMERFIPGKFAESKHANLSG